MIKQKEMIKFLIAVIVLLTTIVGYRELTEYKRYLYYECYYNETVGPITEMWLKQREEICKDKVNEQLEFFEIDHEE